MATRIQIRRGNASAWTSANPILAEGELGVELDTQRFKIGIGTTSWSGLNYATGIQGTTGAQGSQGTTGIQGDTGVQGVTGRGLNIVGNVATVGDLPNPYGGSTGDGYIVTGTGDLHVYNGSSFDNVGQIVGPQGTNGTQGTSGVSGTQGTTGTQGITGTQGLTGTQGTFGTQGIAGAFAAQGIQGTQGIQGREPDVAQTEKIQLLFCY